MTSMNEDLLIKKPISPEEKTASMKSLYSTELKYFAEVFPFVTALTILYSCTKAYTFYSFYFHLNIYNYLEINELLKLLIGDLMWVGTILTFFVLDYGLWKIITLTGGKHEYWSKLGVVAFNILMLCLFINTDDLQEIVWYFGSLAAYGMLLKYKFKEPNVILVATAIVVFVIGSTYAGTVGIKVRYKMLTGGNIVYFKNRTHAVSTPNYIYIGKTNNFIFFFNVRKEMTDVFRMDDVSRLSIRQDL
jgi:hypothetical protein